MSYGASHVNPSSLTRITEPRIRSWRSDSTTTPHSLPATLPFHPSISSSNTTSSVVQSRNGAVNHLLPFNSNEVLVPPESKTLHLYEARYLALLEEALAQKKMFVHFVLDPVSVSNSGSEASLLLDTVAWSIWKVLSA